MGEYKWSVFVYYILEVGEIGEGEMAVEIFVRGHK